MSNLETHEMADIGCDDRITYWEDFAVLKCLPTQRWELFASHAQFFYYSMNKACDEANVIASHYFCFDKLLGNCLKNGIK